MATAGSISSQLVWRTVQIQVLLVVMLARVIGASYCTDEQINNCRKSATDGSLNKLAGGGECQVKRYVQFTHLCTVNNYVPSIDYCCCAHERKILCCRYHYDWNYFRCAEAEDVIDTIADSALPQELLLTAILVPTAAALCCVICCVRCLCCRDDEDESCSCSKCKTCSEKEPSEKYSVGHAKRYEDVQTPLKHQPDTKQPLPDHRYDDVRGGLMTSSLRNGAVPSVPSAPPLEDAAFAHLLPRSSVPPAHAYGRPNATSGPSGYMLHYVPVQTAPSGGLPECTHSYRDPSQASAANPVPDSTYHATGARLADTLSCCHGNATANQTLIGILTNPDGKPILAEHAACPAPRDPPPAYEDTASTEAVKTSLVPEAEKAGSSPGC